MEIVTTFNFLAIFIALVGQITRNEKPCFLFAIVMLIIFYSIRTDYGNDMHAYMYLFDNTSRGTYSNAIGLIENNSIHFEPGWIILNFLFKPFGWQIFITFITIIQFSTVYFLATRYANQKHYWLVLAIYIINSSLLLTSLSMLRQALAMHVVVFSLPYILEKRYLIACCIIFLATTFHTSAIAAFLLIPISFVCHINIKIIVAVFLGAFIFCFIAERFVGDILSGVLASNTFERYQGYADDKFNSGSGLGVALKVFAVIWLLINYAKDNTSKFLTLVYSLFVALIPFIYTIPLVARIGMYFELISVTTLFPKLTNLKKDVVGFGIFAVMLYTFISGYFSFFSNPVWRDAFSVYKTILD